jgi:hypothetical protein
MARENAVSHTHSQIRYAVINGLRLHPLSTRMSTYVLPSLMMCFQQLAHFLDTSDRLPVIRLS